MLLDWTEYPNASIGVEEFEQILVFDEALCEPEAVFLAQGLEVAMHLWNRDVMLGHGEILPEWCRLGSVSVLSFTS